MSVNTHGVNLNDVWNTCIINDEVAPIEKDQQIALVNQSKAEGGVFHWLWVCYKVHLCAYGQLEVIAYQMDKIAKQLENDPTEENICTLGRYIKFVYNEAAFERTSLLFQGRGDIEEPTSVNQCFYNIAHTYLALKAKKAIEQIPLKIVGNYSGPACGAT